MRELPGRRGVLGFFIASFAIFWIMLGLTGAAIALGAPAWLQQVLKNADAWAPTLALVLLFRRLLPGQRLGHWLARSAGSRARAADFLQPLLAQLLAFVAVVGIYALVAPPSAAPIGFKPLEALPLALLVTLTAGPLGEELGWRAFAYGSMRDRGSRMRVALVLGMVWGFWHLPLWLLSGYGGLDLLAYVAAFLLAIVSTSVLIAHFFDRSRNVLVAVWIHFWFNFLLQLVTADLLLLMEVTGCVYAVAAILIIAKDLAVSGGARRAARADGGAPGRDGDL